MITLTDITEGKGGTRVRRQCRGEISGMGGMDLIQALRASLAGKWVSDEDCSIMTLEPT